MDSMSCVFDRKFLWPIIVRYMNTFGSFLNKYNFNAGDVV